MSTLQCNGRSDLRRRLLEKCPKPFEEIRFIRSPADVANKITRNEWYERIVGVLFVMRAFYSEIWLHIAGFVDSPKSFARFWWSTPYLMRSDLTKSNVFWKSMIRQFCEVHELDFNEVIDRADLREIGIHILRPLHLAKRCSRSGCYQMYCEWENGAMQCVYHPGKLRATGYLSCCRGKGFSSTGCKAAYHDGSVFSLIHMRRDTDEDSDNVQLLKSEGKRSAFDTESTNSTLPSLFPTPKNSPAAILAPNIDNAVILPRIV